MTEQSRVSPVQTKHQLIGTGIDPLRKWKDKFRPIFVVDEPSKLKVNWIRIWYGIWIRI
jgi:hypothetical protein